jgi:hypothetical protein
VSEIDKLKMPHLKSCWTPCFWHGNVYDGSIAVAIYTFSMSICIVTYSAYVMNGGDSSQLYLPYFEANLNTTIQAVGIFVIIYFLLLAGFSGFLIHGIRSSILGFIKPWVYSMRIVILFQVMFGLWLIFGYYIYLVMIFAALCDFMWAALNYYCICVVNSHYTNIKSIQSPDIEYLNTY